MFDTVDANNFNKKVLSTRGLVLVNFGVWWSEDSHKMSSLLSHVIDPLLDEQDAIMQVDWDQQKELAYKLEVFGVPTLLIYAGGNEVARYSGIMSKNDLVKRIMEVKHKFFTSKEVRKRLR